MLRIMPKAMHASLMAVRLRTIPIPTIQVLTSVGLAYVLAGTIHWMIAFYTLLIGIFITIGTNLINDVVDFENGGDPLKRFGHVKVIRAGLLTKAQVFVGGMACFGMALACSIPLAVHAGWILFFIVLLSTLLGYSYTGGPFPLCYLGLSEGFIFIFYGLVCIVSAFYVQAKAIYPEVFLCAVQLGMLAIIPNALNNFRDMFEDVEVNKMTLAVRFGKKFARWEITAFMITPFLLNFGWLLWGYVEAALMPLLLLPLVVMFLRSIWTMDPGPIFNRYFGLSVLVHFLFGFLLLVGWLLK